MKAEVGDFVFGTAINAGQIVGIVVGIAAAQQKCNLTIAYGFKLVHNGSSFEELNLKGRMELIDEIARGRRRRLMAVDAHLMTGGSISKDSIFVGAEYGHLMDFEIDYGDADQFIRVTSIPFARLMEPTRVSGWPVGYEMPQGMTWTVEALLSLIGMPSGGSHPDEWKPRAETWHKERLNSIDEKDRILAAWKEVFAMLQESWSYMASDPPQPLPPGLKDRIAEAVRRATPATL
jgi:hypothetical protein